jgi:hypothetical protein
MDNFVCKFQSIFNYTNDENIFKCFKDEVIEFLNERNMRMIDVKSVGSLFGMNYTSDSLKNIDILIELNYDFYSIRNFINDLIKFMSFRQVITDRSYDEIIKSYALDDNELIKSITKFNERKKFKVIQKKVWLPLYETLKYDKTININVETEIKEINDWCNISKKKQIKLHTQNEEITSSSSVNIKRNSKFVNIKEEELIQPLKTIELSKPKAIELPNNRWCDLLSDEE